MANNCTDCDFCLLVDEDCLCSFSPLPKVAANSIMPAILAANATIDTITGKCNICEAQEVFDDLLDTTEFKQYYANLVYKFWLKIYGSGQASKSGLIKKASDEFSDFRVYTGKEVKEAQDTFDDVLVYFERAFLAKFKELHPGCEECEEVIDECCEESSPCDSVCGGNCGDQCTCNKKQSYSISDSAAI